jgi:hypothetical protein
VTQQLAGNPALVDNQQFMASHPSLREYFANHPEVRTELKEHPYQFMSREDQLNNWQGRYFPQGWNGKGYKLNVGWNGNGGNPDRRRVSTMAICTHIRMLRNGWRQTQA